MIAAYGIAALIYIVYTARLWTLSSRALKDDVAPR